jgi:uncharacterized membrane protein
LINLRDTTEAPIPLSGVYRLLGIVFFALVTIDSLWLIIGRIPFRPEYLGPYGLLAFPFAMIALVYLRFRPDPRLGYMALACATFFAFSAPTLLLSQLMVGLQRPLFDDTAR